MNNVINGLVDPFLFWLSVDSSINQWHVYYLLACKLNDQTMSYRTRHRPCQFCLRHCDSPSPFVAFLIVGKGKFDSDEAEPARFDQPTGCRATVNRGPRENQTAEIRSTARARLVITVKTRCRRAQHQLMVIFAGGVNGTCV